MSTLIIKSKVWNLANNQSINYKEKYSRKQKFTIDHSAIIYRQKDKLNYKKIDESNLTSNSNDNTFYMNEKKDELITILKQDENKYVVNCGNWSKDLSKLIDENAAYILYKGLTIENLLKEKQKYYVLNQGDIIKLGKIYLKLLHINLFNSDDDEDDEEEEKKSEANNNNSVKEEQKEESKEKIDESNKIDNKVDLNEEDKKLIKSSLIEEDSSKELIESSKRLLTYTKNDLAKTERNKKRENPLNQNNINNKYINCSFSYVPRNYRNINLYIKECDKENKKERLNKSFNGKIPILNANNIIKESFNINRSKSPKFSQIKSINLLKKFESKKVSHQKSRTKRKEQVKTKLVKNAKQQPSLNQSNKNEDNTYQSKQIINVSESLLPVGKICRICLSGEDNATSNPLICPCECKGSMRYIHYLCLKNWLNLKVESELGHRRDIIFDQPTITYSTNDVSCELCKAKLPDYIRHNGKIFNVLFYKPKYDKFIVLESMRDDNKRTKFIHIIPLVKKNMIKIGRLNTCDLSLPDISISRVHCCVYIEGGQLFMENNSKFGTKILIQNNSLVMSSNFPLCIEIQNTYLKLILKKNFSFFGCCGVNTTTISKMLVYQEQNEKGFDIFCSMIIKDDKDDKDKEDEKDKEEVKEESKENNEIKDNNNNLIKEENSMNNRINKIIEELKDNESIEKMNNDSINNKLINTNVNKLISEHNDDENNSYKGIQLINDSQRDQSRNHVKIEQDNNNLQNLIEDSEEILNIKKEEEKAIKSINIIKEDKKNDLGKLTYRTVEMDNYKNLINDSEIKSRSNIYNEVNSTTQKFNKNLNDKILTNLKKEKYKNKSKEINKAIFKEISKENKDLIDLDSEKENKNIKLQDAKKETQRPKIKKVEIEKIKEIIENNNNIENNSNTENNKINNNIEENKNKNQKIINNEIKEPENQEIIKETNQILFKEENNQNKKEKEKKEPDNKKEKEKREPEIKKEEDKKEPGNKKEEEKKEPENKKEDLIDSVNDEKIVEKKINEIKEEKEKEELIDKISNEESKGDLEEKQNIEMNQKKILGKKFQERLSNNNNNSINMKDTKSLSYQKDETTKNLINLDKTDTVKSIQEEKKIKNMIQKNEEKKVNKEIKKQKKFQNNTIDLNEINELSYGKAENSCNLNYSPINSYQSIFGLRNINNNEGSSLLAPKHKNVNFQKWELNSKVEKKKFNLNNPNISRNKYTNQYEEDKKSKNNI